MFLVCHILIWFSLIFAQHECLGMGYAVCVHIHLWHLLWNTHMHAIPRALTQIRADLGNCHAENQICPRHPAKGGLVNSHEYIKRGFKVFIWERDQVVQHSVLANLCQTDIPISAAYINPHNYLAPHRFYITLEVTDSIHFPSDYKTD